VQTARAAANFSIFAGELLPFSPQLLPFLIFFDSIDGF
jgi:hypothetical protein